MHTLSVHTK